MISALRGNALSAGIYQATLIVLAVALTGCATVARMRAADAPLPLEPDEGYALVVFLQPNPSEQSVPLTLCDGRGRFLGDSFPESYFAVNVPASTRRFVGWRGDALVALAADLAVGKTYYVLIVADQQARTQLLPLTPRDPQWKHLQQWILDSAQLVPDEARGQEDVRRDAAEIADRLRRAERLATRALHPSDGV